MWDQGLLFEAQEGGRETLAHFTRLKEEELFGGRPVSAGSKGIRSNAHNVQAIRELLEKNRRTSPQDFKDESRVSSPAYMPPQCRLTPEGSGGAPLSSARSSTPRSRPASAPLSGRRSSNSGRSAYAKTERWREAGLVRWPQRATQVVKAKPPSDGDPISRGTPTQPNWTGELWIRSLRRPGLLELQDAIRAYSNIGMETIQQEWAAQPPPPWIDAVPYGGSTTNGKVAIQHSKKNEEWVERPVATGKLALNHFNGQRYMFDMKDRGLEPDRKPLAEQRDKRPLSARASRSYRKGSSSGDGAYF